jgi:hypothetical protein
MVDSVDTDPDAAFPDGAIDPGSSVLIAGPAMTGKRELMFRLLGAAGDGLAAFVTTKLDADHFRTKLADHWTVPDWDVRVVDCVSRQHALRPLTDTESVKYVATASDLTGIGIGLSGFMQDAYHRPDVDRAAVGLHSLSTLLMYADLRRVYQFLHVVTGRIATSDFVGAFTLDSARSDGESLVRLKELFDGLVEVRDGEEGPEIRTRGDVDGPRRWTEAYSLR